MLLSGNSLERLGIPIAAVGPHPRNERHPCARPISYGAREFLMRIVLRNKERRELLWGVVGIKLSIGENVVPIVLSFLADVF